MTIIEVIFDYGNTAGYPCNGTYPEQLKANPTPGNTVSNQQGKKIIPGVTRIFDRSPCGAQLGPWPGYWNGVNSPTPDGSKFLKDINDMEAKKRA